MSKDEVAFHLVPGPIISPNDGDHHYISAPQLAMCYQLEREMWQRCTLYPYCRDRQTPHLFPRSKGDYAEALAALSTPSGNEGDKGQ